SVVTSWVELKYISRSRFISEGKLKMSAWNQNISSKQNQHRENLHYYVENYSIQYFSL
ncbi:hypothetical protein L9F63_003787, partial [Diploptera punctata]